MKFTIDTEKKLITFIESFTKQDIEDVMSILKIDGIETWKITMEENKIQPYNPNIVPNNPWTPNTFPFNPGTNPINPYGPTYYVTNT
jgi:hypothetical protein